MKEQVTGISVRLRERNVGIERETKHRYYAHVSYYSIWRLQTVLNTLMLAKKIAKVYLGNVSVSFTIY